MPSSPSHLVFGKAGTGIICGAFGAHGLKNRAGVTPDLIKSWETASHYAVRSLLAHPRPLPTLILSILIGFVVHQRGRSLSRLAPSSVRLPRLRWKTDCRWNRFILWLHLRSRARSGKEVGSS